MKKISLCLLACCLLLLFCPVCAEETVITLSHESGFYPKPISLTITCSQPYAQLHYTLDGTAPTLDSPLYTDPISLQRTVGRYDPLSRITGLHLEGDYLSEKDFPSAHVLRVAALWPDGTVSAETAGTYFVGYSDRSVLFGDLPILSLIMDPGDLFDYEKGIFMLGASFDQWNAQQTEPYEAWEVFGNFSNKGKEWERPVTVDFMLAEGEQFVQNMGLRIKGAASRTAPQKSMRLIAREEYGKKNIRHPLLPGNICQADGTVMEKYKSITLRNGANDRDHARIRDPFISQLARGLNIETALSRAAVCYINGEYWGLYTLTEEYSDHHLANHYGLENENVITIKKSEVEDGVEADADLFWDMYHFISDNDMADPAAYAKAAEMVDIKSLADYAAVTLYIFNEDGIFQYNNWQIWRVRQPQPDQSPLADGKWRMMLYDSDYSSGVYTDGYGYQTNTIRELLLDKEYEEWHPARLITSLMANEDFRREVILSLCDVRNLYFEKCRVDALLASMTAEYEKQTNNTFLRFGPEWIARWNVPNHLEEQLNILHRFFTGRYHVFSSHIRSAFQLKNYSEITVSSSDSAKGSVKVNDRNIRIADPLILHYFTEFPITLTAVPEEGCTFVGWQTEPDGNIIPEDADALSTLVLLNGHGKITAVFE